MSENEKDNKDFEFIKEQVIEKKRKKFRKLLFPTITNLGFALLFGTIAAATFAILEPNFSKFLHKEEETVTPVCFPTECPNEDVNKSNSQQNGASDNKPTPEPVIVEQSIEADIKDYLGMNNDIRDVAYQANMSIVNISSTFAVEDWFGKSVDKEVDSTGLIIYNNTQNLLILVSLDKVDKAKSIRLILADNVMVDAVLQDYDHEINLAMIAVAIEDIPPVYMSNLQPATLGESYTAALGTPIIALGSPNGNPNSMELGYITGKGISAEITDNNLDLFNTSIADNENSDGFIFNLEGKVIGLITRTLKEGNNKYIDTVIGISELRPIIEVMGNKDPHIYFGIKADDMTTSAKQVYKLTNGIYVNEVLSDSPAFIAGIQKGDIILKINSHDVASTSDFNATIANYKPDDKLNILILRASGSKTEEVELKVSLADKSE
jgi:S1-C subfamily serine protease